MTAMPIALTMRPALPHDIGPRGTGGIRDLFNRVRRDERRQGRSPLGPPHYPKWEKHLARQTPHSAEDSIVALKGNAVVAFCMAHHNATTGVTRLDKLFIHPDLQGQGIGQLLLRRIVATAAARGQTGVIVTAEHGPGRASDFYQRHGFHVTATKPGHPPVDILRCDF